ncbi:MAG TPA: divalent metal cation transporter [Casimicrobiaceae bacterium]|nr:divalent metal cation transporter [Casimicrobiaceae bacterium]
MSGFLELFLGILTAMGGFVEIGELTFAVNAGAKFGYALLWVAVVGTLGIIVYGEMAGRVAAVRGQPVFNLIRERVGFDAGLVTLIAATGVNVLTCAAEIGGVALIWQLLAGWPYRVLVAIAFVFLTLAIWALPFQWIERVFGLGGLLLVIYLVVAITEGPQWGDVAAALLPNLPKLESRQEYLLYTYYCVALVSSIMLPYETYFYSSGAIEDRWKPSDIAQNRIIVIVGFVLGSVLCASLIMIGTQFFGPRHAEPQLPGLVANSAAVQYGVIGLLIAVGGMFFAFAGAAIETGLCSAYNIAQFFGWPWGKFRPPREASRFTVCWIVVFALATLVILTGVDPVSVVEYSIVFSVVILPLTYLPLLVVSSDERLMGKHVNGPLAKTLGWIYMGITTIAALAAIPLLVLTHGGQG